jgi:hypothetical protein
MIERGGVHANPHIVRRCGFGHRNIVAEYELIEVTVSVDGQRSHEVPRQLYSPKTSLAPPRTPGACNRAFTQNARDFRAATPIPVTGFAE